MLQRIRKNLVLHIRISQDVRTAHKYNASKKSFAKLIIVNES